MDRPWVLSWERRKIRWHRRFQVSSLSRNFGYSHSRGRGCANAGDQTKTGAEWPKVVELSLVEIRPDDAIRIAYTTYVEVDKISEVERTHRHGTDTKVSPDQAAAEN